MLREPGRLNKRVPLLEIKLAADANEIDTGAVLSLIGFKHFEIETFFDNATAGGVDVRMFINNDTTVANYESSCGGLGYTWAQVADACFFAYIPASGATFNSARLQIARSRALCLIHGARLQSNEKGDQDPRSLNNTVATTNITQLKFISVTAGNNIKAGSYIKIYGVN